ncbi:nuclear transcription factor Y subunit C-4-like isoform X1 [Dendrobium catenatum]|uniref:Nuclear transcription factor Y subunit C-4 n=2 Tax=Dendrobium catenatum TaxID=906689 RepID=A0A2I0X0Z5_9ASPA|nr:nuclear transcription factor Y subunit C-4-like isoform X1 [Dendrobium catenatum]XP_020690328.1 nuclear transcription factor Y subunit C-4-like isoform X1 [Dendrobium catenatum]PKU81573.1 Nuclear transcription factor Y subunit C-4 [Dendrobium catenatum]
MEQNQQAGSSSAQGYPQPQTSFHQLLQQQHQQLHMFWTYQRQEMEQAGDFKNHQLPLARIKKIMKADEDVRMISAEAPILFAKACELFILELTIRSWIHAEENKRRTLQKNDIAAAITRTDIFDFLVDIVPREDIKEVVAAAPLGGEGAAAAGVPYYYSTMGATGMYVGQPPGMGWWGEEDGSGGFGGGGGGGGVEVVQGYGVAGDQPTAPAPPPGS